MENVKVTGVIKSISEKVVTEHGTRLEYVVTHSEVNGENTWETPFKFEMFKKPEFASHIDNFIEYNSVGDTVEVEFQIRGREWTSPQGEVKVFNSFNPWRVEKVSTNAPVQQEVESNLPF